MIQQHTGNLLHLNKVPQQPLLVLFEWSLQMCEFLLCVLHGFLLCEQHGFLL